MKHFWHHLSHFILNNRVALLLTLALSTAAMGFMASRVQLSYELVKILPASDPNFQLYEAFKQRYGEDGNVLVAGVSTPKMYDLPFFNDWYDLSDRLKKLPGVKDVLSNSDL